MVRADTVKIISTEGLLMMNIDSNSVAAQAKGSIRLVETAGDMNLTVPTGWAGAAAIESLTSDVTLETRDGSIRDGAIERQAPDSAAIAKRLQAAGFSDAALAKAGLTSNAALTDKMQFSLAPDLMQAIFPHAEILGGVPDVGAEKLNIKARNISLTALGNADSSIGYSSDRVSIATPGDFSTLTGEEKTLLARARAQDVVDVSYRTYRYKGETGTMDLSAESLFLNSSLWEEVSSNASTELPVLASSDGLGDVLKDQLVQDRRDVLSITIQSSDDLNLLASGSVAAKAVDDVLITARGDVLINDGSLDGLSISGIEARDGRLRLETSGGILGMGTQAVAQLRSGGDLQLITHGVDGNIGGAIRGASDTVSLRIDAGRVDATSTLTVDAAGTAMLMETAGAMYLSHVISREGDISLQVEAGSLFASARSYDLGNVHVSADHVTLIAGDIDNRGGSRHIGDLGVIRTSTNTLTASTYSATRSVIAVDNAGDLTVARLSVADQGRVQVRAGGDLTVATDVYIGADDGGQLVLDAQQGSLIIEQDLLFGTGRMELLALKDVIQRSESAVVNAGGVLNVRATDGSVIQEADALLSNASDLSSKALVIQAGLDVVVSEIDAGKGALSLTTENGSILEAGGDDADDLLGATITITSAGDVGRNGRRGQALEIAADSIGVTAGGQVALLASRTLTLESLQAGATATLRTSAGSMTVAGDVDVTAGNLLLQTLATNASLILTADHQIRLDGGSMSLIAGDTITLASNTLIANAGGSIDLEASAGSLQMNASAQINSEGGNILLVAGGDISMATVDARLANGSLNANGSRVGVLAGGSIVNILDPSAGAVNLYGEDALLRAGSGMGGSTDVSALVLAVNRVSAHTVAGDIRLRALGDLEIGPVADLYVNRVVETGLTSPLWTLEQSGMRAGGRIFVSSTGAITLRSEPALDEGVVVKTGAGGAVTLQATKAIELATVVLPDVPLVQTGTLNLSASRIAALTVAVDVLSVSVSNGNLMLTDIDGWGEAAPGLVLSDINAPGSISVTAQGDLSVEKVRSGDGADISLISLAGDLLLVVADALAKNFDGLGLMAAGFISSPRLFTGASRTEYRSGGALRIGTASAQLPGAAVIEPTKLTGTPSLSVLSAVLPTQQLILRSDSAITIAGSYLPRGGETTIQAAQGIFISQAVSSEATRFAQVLQAPVLAVMEDSALVTLDESLALAQLSGAASAGSAPILPGPTLALPSNLPITPGSASALRLPAAAFGMGAENITVTLKVSDGAISETAPSMVTVSGSATERGYTASASVLSSWFASADAPHYLGSGGQTLAMTVARGPVSVQTQLNLYDGSVVNSTVAPPINLPAQFTVLANNGEKIGRAHV
jgi:hypothetical protein